MAQGISVSRAAEELDLSEQRIRALISGGRIRAEKVGGRWLVDVDSLDRRRDQQNERGRPFSSGNAWGYLYLLSGEDPEWLSPWSRSRLRRRLHEEPPHQQALDRRAVRHDFYSHPGVLPRLEKDHRLVRSGISAAQAHGLDVLARGALEAYVKSEDLQSVVKRYKLSIGDRPNVILNEVPEFWPFEQESIAPIAVVAWDLAGSRDARSRRTGNAILRQLRKRMA